MPAALEAEFQSFRLQIDAELYSHLAILDPSVGQGQLKPLWVPGAIEIETVKRAHSPVDFFRLAHILPYHTVALALPDFPQMRRQYLAELSGACPPAGQPSQKLPDMGAFA